MSTEMCGQPRIGAPGGRVEDAEVQDCHLRVLQLHERLPTRVADLLNRSPGTAGLGAPAPPRSAAPPAALSCGAGPFGGIANGVLLNDGNTENAYWSVAVVCVLIQEGQLGAVPRGSRPSRAISRSLGLASRGTGTGAANWPPGPGPVTTSGMMSSRLVARAARRARAG